MKKITALYERISKKGSAAQGRDLSIPRQREILEQFAKKNGFDLGIDYHQYSPISIEQVKWFANAMKYWDQNVYSDSCNVVLTPN